MSAMGLQDEKERRREEFAYRSTGMLRPMVLPFDRKVEPPYVPELEIIEKLEKAEERLQEIEEGILRTSQSLSAFEKAFRLEAEQAGRAARSTHRLSVIAIIVASALAAAQVLVGLVPLFS
ncbi:hypothetical protein [Pseudoroseicyclus sp. CXY001]|uniref:hypothetical protein n=1 Tax=Pseudoroseicyclus sp. CXY001 TaxID=3242492 RepID=UPI003571174D